MGPRLRSAVLAAVLLVVCGLTASSASAYAPPTVNALFDYQIGGIYTPLSTVRTISRDRTAAPVSGLYNICYVNAFQTQPSEVTWWRANYPTLLLRDSAGEYVIDGEWDEILLDTRTSAKRTTLGTILSGWFDGCKNAGFDAIEPDNLDSWDRSADSVTGRSLITKSNNLAVMRAMATSAHTAGTSRTGLAIAQKNTSEIASQLRGYGYDFVIAEECQVYTGNYGLECDDYIHYYGNNVIEIEYTDNEALYPGDDPDYPRGGTGFYADACRARGASISIILRDRRVTPSSSPDYVYRSC